MDTPMPRALAAAALDAHKQVTDLVLAQGKVAEEAAAQAFASARAGLELHRDLAQGLAKTWIDAVAPAPESSAKA
jgi:hypothetical protein